MKWNGPAKKPGTKGSSPNHPLDVPLGERELRILRQLYSLVSQPKFASTGSKLLFEWIRKKGADGFKGVTVRDYAVWSPGIRYVLEEVSRPPFQRPPAYVNVRAKEILGQYNKGDKF